MNTELYHIHYLNTGIFIDVTGKMMLFTDIFGINCDKTINGIVYNKNGVIIYKGGIKDGKYDGYGEIIVDNKISDEMNNDRVDIHQHIIIENEMNVNKLQSNECECFIDKTFTHNPYSLVSMGLGDDEYENNTKYIRKYIGQFIDGKRNGYGILYYETNNEKKPFYIGEWKDDLPNGKGCLFCDKCGCIVFDGYFVNGLKHGICTYYSDRSKEILYHGEYKNGIIDGYGYTVYKEYGGGNQLIEGYFFEGLFRDGKPVSGTFYNLIDFGKCYEINGNIMTEYRSIDNDNNDIDWYKINDGIKKIYVGQYELKEKENDVYYPKRHGFGTLYYKSGRMHKVGVWEEKKYVINEYNLSGNDCYIYSKEKMDHGYYDMNYELNGNSKECYSYLIYHGEMKNNMYYGNGIYYDGEGCYIGEFNRNLRHGEGKIKDKLGKTIKSGIWKSGNIISGIITGYYNDTNQKEFEYNTLDGIKHGEYTSWYKNGKLKEKCVYKNSLKHGKQIMLDENDILISEYEYINGSKSGLSLINKKNKTVVGTYNHNLKNGCFKTKINGITIKKYGYINGIRNGKARVYTTDGIIVLKGHYVNGMMNGKIELFDPKTKKKIFDGEYKNGLKCGYGK